MNGERLARLPTVLAHQHDKNVLARRAQWDSAPL
jgi:hypothetical protein